MYAPNCHFVPVISQLTIGSTISSGFNDLSKSSNDLAKSVIAS